MPRKAAKIQGSERQRGLLEEFSRSRTYSKSVVQRATINLLGLEGLLNEEIALQVGQNRQDEAIRRKNVETISQAQVGRILQQAALQPHRKKMWLTTTEKDRAKFQREVEVVCQTYLEAPGKAAADGTHTVSVDEATSLQALERNAPDPSRTRMIHGERWA